MTASGYCGRERIEEQFFEAGGGRSTVRLATDSTSASYTVDCGSLAAYDPPAARAMRVTRTSGVCSVTVSL